MAAGLTTLLIIWFFILINATAIGQQNAISQYIENEFDWDLIVSGAGLDVRDPETSIPAEVVEAISTRDDVALLVQEHLAPYRYEDIDFTIRAVELDAYLRSGNQFTLELGDPSTASFARSTTKDNIAAVNASPVAAP